MPSPHRHSFRPELLIFGVALLVRLGLFLAVGSWDEQRLRRQIFVGDARGYHRLAVNLVEHGVYSNRREPPLTPDTFRVPLYSGYLALVYRVFGPLPWLALLPQLAMSALTCALVCRIGTVLFDRRAGIVAGSIFALDYTSILFSNRLYADTLFTLLVAASLLALSHFLAGRDDRGRGDRGWGGRERALLVAGFCMGLATLCRPVSLYWIVALAPVLWLRMRDRPGAVLARVGLLAAVYLLTLSPWMLRNFVLLGRPYVTSMQAAVGEWYMPAVAGETHEHPDRMVRAPRPKPEWTPSHLMSDARAFGRGFIRYFAILGSGEVPLILGIRYQRHDSEALREAGLSAWLSATLRHRTTPFQRAVVVSIAGYLALLYLAAARGLWVAARRRLWVESLLLLATVAYFMVATGPISREVRYRLPALPAIIVLAGLGLAGRARINAVEQRS